MIGGYASVHVHTRVAADDGTMLAASFLPVGVATVGRHGSSRPPTSPPLGILLVHGFGAHRRKPAYAALADGLARVAPVLAIDLRGHGGSAGASTFGDREEADVRAGAAWLHRCGFDRVVAVGVSMGATAAMHAAWRGAPLSGLVAVSAPARFRDPAPEGPLRRLEALWHSGAQRRLLQAGLGVVLAPPNAWRSPPDPESMLADLDVPLLLVHGEDDAYFPIGDALSLAAAHRGPVALWREPIGFGHAEDGITPHFVSSVGDAIIEQATTGAFPARRPPLGE